MATEKTTTAVDPEGAFGLRTTRLSIDPAAPVEELLFDALCLVRNALAVFESMTDDGEASEVHYAGLYLLRQGVSALTAAQLTPCQGAAAMAALGGGAR